MRVTLWSSVVCRPAFIPLLEALLPALHIRTVDLVVWAAVSSLREGLSEHLNHCVVAVSAWRLCLKLSTWLIAYLTQQHPRAACLLWTLFSSWDLPAQILTEPCRTLLWPCLVCDRGWHEEREQATALWQAVFSSPVSGRCEQDGVSALGKDTVGSWLTAVRAAPLPFPAAFRRTEAGHVNTARIQIYTNPSWVAERSCSGFHCCCLL